MTAWVLVSIPFWWGGFFMSLFGPYAVYARKRPGETEADLVLQAGTAFAMGIIMLLIACWMCS